MKDSEFIELLNLYLDHEISVADAARLEAEVQGNANRRRVYQDYCRMQKACKLLAQDFATEAPAEVDHKVVAFPQTRTASSGRRQLGYVGAGLFAAAACVAAVFLTRAHINPVASPISNAVAVQDTPRSVPVQAVATVAPAVQSSNALLLRNRERTSGLVIAKQSDPHLAWIENVQLSPVQVPAAIDPLHLENTLASRTDERTYTSGNKPLPPDVQSISIRFQR